MDLARIVLLTGVAYVVLLGVMFVRGAGIAAAYFAMPGWYVVAGAALVLEFIVPTSTTAWLYSWTSNLILVILSGVLNVTAAYWFTSTIATRVAGLRQGPP
jgi:hypothetical protein